MPFDNLLAGGNISASGLGAERMRMEVIANNIANAHSTRGVQGGPYRRQEVLFQSVMNDQTGRSDVSSSALGGVQVVGVVDDPTTFPRVFDPGHPDSDNQGFVMMPNVAIPTEMVNLMTASRAYEANLKALQTLRQQLEQTITLLRY